MNLLSGNLTSVSPFVSALGTINKSISYFAAFTLIGVLLSLAFFIIEDKGKLQNSALKLRNVGSALATIWFVTSGFHIVLTLANILGTNLSSAFDLTTLSSFIRQIELGRYLAFQTIVIGFVLIALNFIRGALPSALLLGLSIIALIAPAFQSHSASSGSHSLAIGSLVVHIIALSLWVGGVFAIALLEERRSKGCVAKI